MGGGGGGGFFARDGGGGGGPFLLIPAPFNVVELGFRDMTLPCDVAGEVDSSPYERSGLVLLYEPVSSAESAYGST